MTRVHPPVGFSQERWIRKGYNAPSYRSVPQLPQSLGQQQETVLPPSPADIPLLESPRGKERLSDRGRHQDTCCCAELFSRSEAQALGAPKHEEPLRERGFGAVRVADHLFGNPSRTRRDKTTLEYVVVRWWKQGLSLKPPEGARASPLHLPQLAS